MGLPEPVYDRDGITLYHGDCLDLLPHLPAVDAVVTDPPYGVRAEAWDDMTDRELARFSMAWMALARGVAPEFIVFSPQRSLFENLCRMLFSRVREMVWYKPRGSQYAGSAECGAWFAHETILHCHDWVGHGADAAKNVRVGQMIRDARMALGYSRGAIDVEIRGKRTGLCYRWEEGACLPTPEQADRLAEILTLPPDFAEALAAASQEKARLALSIDVFEHRTVSGSVHPCEKPVRLLVDVLDAVGTGYGTVLDPFAGSGSTAIACMRTGRRCILIEKDERYIGTIVRRLRDAETPLFATHAEG